MWIDIGIFAFLFVDRIIGVVAEDYSKYEVSSSSVVHVV